MSFLVAFNGQFTPLTQTTAPKPRRNSHPARKLSSTSDATDFRHSLEGATKNPPKKDPWAKKVTNAYQKEQLQFEEEKKRHYARDIMSSPVKGIQEDALIGKAQDMFSSFGFRHLPVLNSENIIVGMLSQGHLAQLEQNTKCSEVMLKKVVVAEEHTSIHEIALILLEEKLNALPIINHHREISGIVTLSDILKYVISCTPFLGHA